MKRRIIAAALTAVLLCTGGCGGLDDPAAQTPGAALTQTDAPAETAAIPEGAITDDEGKFAFTGKTQQVGDDDHGYLQVPLGYLPFQEEGVDGLVQYSDSTGTNILTLQHYADMDYSTAAQSMFAYMQSNEDVEGLTGATVTAGGYDALQIYGHYKDGYFLVIWFIDDPSSESGCYYLAIEFDGEHQDLIALSSTFQNPADFHASGKSVDKIG